MSLTEISHSAQNYLKVIWSESEWSQEPITPSLLAEKLGLRLPTVSEGIRKLKASGFVSHTPYGAVTLTDKGKRYALEMVRRHRLIETFLVETLAYSWHEVHDEAEQLEHSVSDLMISRIDALLGYPERDPHGDPIPQADGTLILPKAQQLGLVEAPAVVCVERIDDSDPDLLEFFEQNGIAVDCRLRVEAGSAYSGTISVQLLKQAGSKNLTEPLFLGADAAAALYVSVL